MSLTWKIKKQRLISLNTVFMVSALLAAFSLAELPLLHRLHHHEQSELSSVNSSAQSYTATSEKIAKTTAMKFVCPLCAIGGSVDQVIVGNARTNLFSHNSVMFFAEPSIQTGITYLYARQRAPPVV